MKKIILSLMLLAPSAHAQSTTTYFGFTIPAANSFNWNTPINNNFWLLDADLNALRQSTSTTSNVKSSTGTCILPYFPITLNSGNVVCAQPSNVTGNAATVTNGMYSNAGPYEAVRVGTATVSTYTTGNAATVTNGLYSNGSYSQPSWLTSVLGSIVSGNISGTSSGAPPTGAASGDLTGTYPAPTLAAVGTAGTYGSATIVPTITTDSKGRVIAVSSNTIPTQEVSTNTITGIMPITKGGTGNTTGNAATVTNGMYSNAGPYEAVRVGTATVSTYTTGNAATVTNGMYSNAGPYEAVRVGSSTVSSYTTGNAATVTTNANLTGPVTSVGNATTIALSSCPLGQYVEGIGPTACGTPAGTYSLPSTVMQTNAAQTMTSSTTVTTTGNVYSIDASSGIHSGGTIRADTDLCIVGGTCLSQASVGGTQAGTTSAPFMPYASGPNTLASSQMSRDSATAFTMSGSSLTITSGKLTLNGAVIQGDNSGSITVPVATVTFVNGGGAPVSTVQVLTTGTSATYTTPGHVRQLKIRMCGGGGGGGAQTANAGSAGGATSFNSITAAGGSGGTSGDSAGWGGGTGGTGGTGAVDWRSNGGAGGPSDNTYTPSGNGGNSLLGSGAGPTLSNCNGAGIAAAANSCGGGSGACGGASSGAGGGAGEYAEFTINAPAATYTYTIGASGAGGTAGSKAGGAGGTGKIIVSEFR